MLLQLCSVDPCGEWTVVRSYRVRLSRCVSRQYAGFYMYVHVRHGGRLRL